MIITKVEKIADLIMITIDAYPDLCPVFNLHDVANGSQLIDKVKDRLRSIVQDPEPPPDDPHIGKFNHLKQELTDRDIGDL